MQSLLELVELIITNPNYLARVSKCSCQINVFLNRLNGQPIGVSVLGIFVIEKNIILAVR